MERFWREFGVGDGIRHAVLTEVELVGTRWTATLVLLMTQQLAKTPQIPKFLRGLTKPDFVART